MERVYKGQIYLAHLKGIGSEQQGKRPVVILQNNTGNKHSPTTIIAPITTADRRRMLPVQEAIASEKTNKSLKNGNSLEHRDIVSMEFFLYTIMFAVNRYTR